MVFSLTEDRTAARTDSQEQLTITVAVPDMMTRVGLATILRDLPTVSRVLECATFDHASETLPLEQVDALIVPAPKRNCEHIRRLTQKAADSSVKVLFLLDRSDEQDLTHVTALPADGFMLQSEVTREMLESILQRTSRGEMSIPSSLARELFSHARQRPERSPSKAIALTPREQQALTLLADGLSNKQIARRLGISEHGAKRHVANVLAKLNSPNRTLAVAIAIREGLLVESAS